MAQEANFWKLLKKNLPDKCIFSRIESRTTKGIPDIHFLWLNTPFWIELKTTKHNAVALSPFQISWNTTYWNNGGICFILVKRVKDRGLFLFEGGQASKVREFGLLEPSVFSGSGFGDLWKYIGNYIEKNNPSTKTEREEKSTRVNCEYQIF